MKIRVYVAGRHALLRHGMAALITAQHDMEVCGEAEDFATSIHDVTILRPDVVVVDLSIHGNRGMQLLKWIRSFDPGIRVVVLSIHNQTVHTTPAIKTGAEAFVLKGDVGTNLIKAIRRDTKGQTHAAPTAGGPSNEPVPVGPKLPGDSPMADLSPRQFEIAALTGAGHSTREIASRLHTSVKSVRAELKRVRTKARVATAIEFMQFCMQCAKKKAAS